MDVLDSLSPHLTVSKSGWLGVLRNLLTGWGRGSIPSFPTNCTSQVLGTHIMMVKVRCEGFLTFTAWQVFSAQLEGKNNERGKPVGCSS